MNIHGARRVGYGLEVGRSVRTAGGAGHIVSPRAQLVLQMNLQTRTLLVGRQEGHPACKKVGCLYVDGDALTGDLHVL